MPPEDLRLLFAHQSVGANLLDGLGIVAPNRQFHKLGDALDRPSTGGIHHCLIGRNHDPYSKISEFERILLDRTDRFNVALLKFCYVDINRDTDIFQLYETYMSMVERISASLPDLRLFHSTVPLRHVKLGLRSYLRLIVGLSIDAVEDNVQRERYNALIRSEWGGTNSVFDIAKAESTCPDRTVASIRYRGSRVAMLCDKYSSDGGHLNRDGAAAVATAFLQTFELTTGIGEDARHAQ